MKRGFHNHHSRGSGGHSLPDAEGYIHFHMTLVAVLAMLAIIIGELAWVLLFLV